MKNFRKMVALVLVGIMIVGSESIIKAKDSKKESKKEYLVFVKTKKEQNSIKNSYESLNSEYTKYLEEENISLSKMTDSQAQELEENNDIISVEKNIKITASGEDELLNPDEVDDAWNIQMIHAEKMQDQSLEDNAQKRVKVAVIDSGIDMCEGIEVQERYNLVPSEEDTLPIYDDITGHGTAIASVIAGEKVKDRKSAGINKNVELYSIKVMEGDNTAPLSRIVEAIYKAIEYDVDIINMSFGTITDSEILHQAIKEADEAGILMIAAAGNRGKEDGAVEYPAAYNEVMAVGSVDSNGEISDTSSKGKNIDVMAPGELVKTAANFGLETVTSGTSISVPHVVGIASILWEKDRSKSSKFIRELIKESANNVIKNNESYEIIDLKYALNNYKAFDENYKEHSFEIKENHEELTINDDMVGVTARWSKNNHEILVNNNKNGSLTTDELKWIRSGIRYNDQYLSSGTVKERAVWHALAYKESETGVYMRTNYVVSAYFAGKIIQKKDCSTSSFTNVTINGLTTKQKNQMIKDINGIKLDNVTKMNIVGSTAKLTDKNKRLLLFGMSLHTITDAFAHRAYRKIEYMPGNSWDHWVHIPGGKDGQADVITFIPNRFKAAGKVVKNAMMQCLVFEGNSVQMIKSYTIRSRQIMENNTFFDSSFLLADLGVYAESNKANDNTYTTWQEKLWGNTFDTVAAGVK